MFQRNTQGKDLKAEDHELFVNVGQMCIAQGDSAQLLDFISDEKNQVNVEVFLLIAMLTCFCKSVA